jgi:hypothetical protein
VSSTRGGLSRRLTYLRAQDNLFCVTFVIMLHKPQLAPNGGDARFRIPGLITLR